MGGKSSKRKGSVYEREVAAKLAALGFEARRGIVQGSTEYRPDVEGTPWWVECKHHAKPAIAPALRQAEGARASAKDGRPALVIAKITRAGETATMRLEDFLELARHAINGGYLERRKSSADGSTVERAEGGEVGPQAGGCDVEGEDPVD